MPSDVGRAGAARRVRALMLALTLAAAGCTGDSGTDAANPATEPSQTENETQTEPGTAFSWSGDDLGEWVTEDEMIDTLIGLSTRYARRHIDGEAVLEHGGIDSDWAWTLEPHRYWSVTVHDGDHGGKDDGPPTETDPRLPEGVTYEPLGCRSYVLSGPNSDELVCVTLPWLPKQPSGNNKAAEARVHEDVTFALASMLLQEMGWADQPRRALAPSPNP